MWCKSNTLKKSRLKTVPLAKVRGIIFTKEASMQTVFTLNKLSMDFYTNYPATRYAEIEYKPSRPYVVMVVEIDGNKFA